MKSTLALLLPVALSLACAGNEAARSASKADSPTVGSKRDDKQALPESRAAAVQANEVMPTTRPIYFAYDEATLTDEGRLALDETATWLQKHPGAALVLEGHADDRGSDGYNLALGQRRADVMREYLQRLGVKPAQLKAVSYGAHRPAVAGAGEQAWSKNRRGELVLKAAS